MMIRIDAARLTDAAGLHAALGEAFGFAAGYGKNLDALVDCLTHLDDPAADVAAPGVPRPGSPVRPRPRHGPGKPESAQLGHLVDAAAFVNWRRLERDNHRYLRWRTTVPERW